MIVHRVRNPNFGSILDHNYQSIARALILLISKLSFACGNAESDSEPLDGRCTPFMTFMNHINRKEASNLGLLSMLAKSKRLIVLLKGITHSKNDKNN